MSEQPDEATELPQHDETPLSEIPPAAGGRDESAPVQGEGADDSY